MSELARSFGDVADAYELGRPRFPAQVVAVIAQAAGGPRLLDVGAGTGRLSGPLLEQGYDVVAVEPLDGMRAILARKIGADRALAGRAEALPLPDASVDAAICSDAWHWFDGARAADELHRVLRFPPEFRPAWVQETEELLSERWEAVHHPYRDGTKRPDGLEGHPGFEPLEVREVPFIDHSDRERIVAHWHSMSAVASLEPAERTRVLGEIDAILERHGVQTVDRPYTAELWITRRRPAPRRPADPRAAAS
jgi:SAM-dependent methyltransferase